MCIKTRFTISDVHFNRTTPLNWLGPENWCEVASPEGGCLAMQPHRFDTEKVPCGFDDVVFPQHSSFLVKIPSQVDIYINSLSIGGKVSLNIIL